MKKIYEAPELELKSFKLPDVILVSTEGTINSEINGGGGGGGENPFDDI
nr:hypothetical protein [uncultured Ruminococcus sp.]